MHALSFAKCQVKAYRFEFRTCIIKFRNESTIYKQNIVSLLTLLIDQQFYFTSNEFE